MRQLDIILDTGYRIQNKGYRIRIQTKAKEYTGYKTQDNGYRTGYKETEQGIKDTRYRTHGIKDTGYMI